MIHTAALKGRLSTETPSVKEPQLRAHLDVSHRGNSAALSAPATLSKAPAAATPESRPERAVRHRLHALVRAADRCRTAASRREEHGPRRPPVRLRRADHRRQGRRDRDAGAWETRPSTATMSSPPHSGKAHASRSPPGRTTPSARPSRPSAATPGRTSSTRTRSSTRSGQWISDAEVAEVGFTAFTSKAKQIRSAPG